MRPLRILVADDHDVVRHGVIALLSKRPDWTVCGEASNGREAVEQAQRLAPDVVILDVAMPELNGLEAARRIHKALPRARLLILTMHESEQLVREMLGAGARGYLLKSDAGRDLIAAVEALEQQRTFYTASIADRVTDAYLSRGAPAPPQSRQLTAREREIVQLLSEGRSNKEIAARLDISVKTVETHRANTMRKLGLRGLGELVRYAIRNGISQP
ncbi:MAG TPA: response regulator transcription factor [Candidatus Polarisedimenticolaceae bacterium]|nr:response regulator transcription factor [Candidatus Polarisedimenticolaceae bacterium]